MKQAADLTFESSSRRFTGWGILLAVLLTLLLSFLFIGPLIEKNAYLGALDDVDDEKRLSRGLLTLCSTSTHIGLLNEKVAKKERAKRLTIVQAASELGCLPKLQPAFQAEHWIWSSKTGSVAGASALGEDAVEPAISALESNNDQVRATGARVLVALHEYVNQDRRTRIHKRIGTKEGEALEALRQSLDIFGEYKPLPVQKPLEEAPKGEDPFVPSTSADLGTDQPTADMGTATEEEEDGFQLGSGGLKLQLGGFDEPAPIKRDPQPSSPTPKVLYKKEEATPPKAPETKEATGTKDDVVKPPVVATPKEGPEVVKPSVKPEIKTPPPVKAPKEPLKPEGDKP